MAVPDAWLVIQWHRKDASMAVPDAWLVIGSMLQWQYLMPGL